MNTPPLERYLRKWRLNLDGPLLETPFELAPCRCAISAGLPMLKMLKRTSDEQAGGETCCAISAGNGAVRLIAADQ